MALNGKIAYIDLSRSEVKTESVPEAQAKLLLGGRGIGIGQLLARQNPGVDALSPESVVVVSAGLLSGMLAPASGRTHITARSPLTGLLGSANIGGFFAPELRRAGYDHLVITGRAKRPSFIFAHNGRISIGDASGVWGQSVPDTQEILRKELEDDDVQAICIGVAGEKLVKFATVATRHQAASGRTGMGAVFGSKNLKAVVVRGDRSGTPIARPGEALAYDAAITESIVSSDFGRRMQSAGVSSIDGQAESFTEQTIGMDGCFGCQLHCRRRYAIRRGPYAGAYGQGPGYRAERAWREILGTDNDGILMANCLVNAYGLDSLETANLIAWAIQLAEEGVIAEKEAGIDLCYPETDTVLKTIGMIARREGLGAVLAEGGARAATHINKGAVVYLREIKGMADVFGGSLTPWQGLGIATSNSGADHLRFLAAADPCRLPEAALVGMVNSPVLYTGSLSSEPWDYGSAPWLVMWWQMCGMAADILGICEFQTAMYDPRFPRFEEMARMIGLNTGTEVSALQLWQAAQGAFTLEKQFNLREGLSAANESLNDWYPPSRCADAKRLNVQEFRTMLSKYYQLQGWDANGVPAPDVLKRLGGK